ncbi:MAG: hypothetical protein IKU30_02770 [Clostridia bacterium]|nr:hypothetical protein [Clostridia bacterium]
MNELIKNIRKNYIIDVLKSIIPTILLNGVTIGMLYMAFYNEFEGSYLFLALVCGLFSVTCLVMFIKSLILAINPFKSDVFKKYGTPEKVASIYREIENTTEYEDRTMIISHRYICHKSRAEILVACNDVLAVHKLVHKTNLIIDYYQIVITDKYGAEFHFTYDKKEESLVDTLLIRIKGKCRNAEAGYTQDELDHIRANKVPLNNSTHDTPFVATFKSDAEKRKEQLAKQKRGSAWKTFWKRLGLFVLSIICSEIILMVLLGDSIEGNLALLLMCLTAIPFFGLFCYLFIVRKNKTTASVPTVTITPISPRTSPKNSPTPDKPIAPVSAPATDKVGNYGIINNSLGSGFTKNARTIIKEKVTKTVAEHGLIRKTDLMKIVFEYVSNELSNKQETKTDLIVSAYYQIAFDEIISRCGDMNDLIFSYSVSKVSGTISKDIHKYLQMIVKIQLLIDDAIASSQNSDVFCGYSNRLKFKIFYELNSYIDDSTDWNKLL